MRPTVGALVRQCTRSARRLVSRRAVTATSTPERRQAAAIAHVFGSNSHGTTAGTRFLAAAAVVAAATSQFVTSDESGGGSMAHALAAPASPPSLADAIANAMPSCVRIRPIAGGERALFGEATSTGSGFVISEDGYLVTNNHVHFVDGRHYQAKVIGGDEWCDAAVLKIESRDKFQPIKLGASSELRLGDTVVALGHPLGLKFAASSGIVSSTDNVYGDELILPKPGIIPELTTTYHSSVNVATMIQTDAKIVPGNSGGPLIDSSGAVVAIATLVVQMGSAFGMNMAMPIDAALPVIRQIVKTGQATRNYLGMTVVALSSTVVDSVNKQNPKLRVKENSGLFITSVRPDGPAAKAGIQTSDVLVSLDGQPTKSFARMFDILSVYEEGRVIDAVILRQGKRKRIKLNPTALNPPSRRRRVVGRP